MDKSLRPGQVERRLGVSSYRLEAMTARGEIECVHLASGHRRYLASEVERVRSWRRRHGEWLSPRQAADVLGVSIYQLDQLARYGKVPYTILPSGYRRFPAFEVADAAGMVDELLASLPVRGRPAKGDGTRK